MFGISGLELVIIVLFVFFVFGPDKLPELGRMLGKALKMFDDAKNEVELVVKTEILRPEDTKMVREVTRDFKDLTASLKDPETIFGVAPRRPLETAEQMTEKVAAHTEAVAAAKGVADKADAEEVTAEVNVTAELETFEVVVQPEEVSPVLPLERTDADMTLAERIYAATNAAEAEEPEPVASADDEGDEG